MTAVLIAATLVLVLPAIAIIVVYARLVHKARPHGTPDSGLVDESRWAPSEPKFWKRRTARESAASGTAWRPSDVTYYGPLSTIRPDRTPLEYPRNDVATLARIDGAMAELEALDEKEQWI
jgi:hypothetical protein